MQVVFNRKYRRNISVPMLLKGMYYIIDTIKIAYTITEATRVRCEPQQ